MTSRQPFRIPLARIAFLSVCGIFAAAAQTIYTGELTGRITDPSGKAIAGARIELASSATGEKSMAASDSAGEFRFPLLRPGEYTLTLSAAGFEIKTEHTTVELGQSSSLAIEMGVAAKRESVVVTAEAPLLQNNNANLATTFNRQEIEDLPLPGGDLTVYAFTAPGVTMSTAMGWGNFSANGVSALSNLFTLNGADITDAYSHLNLTGASYLTLGGNEIQEAAVVLNGYSGQYGRQAGANVNYITKSGSNAFHGNASWQYNERKLNGNDFFNNATGTPRPFSISNAWAGSLGGPIRKNKLFFFFDSEGLRFVLPSGGPVFIPTSDFASYTLAHLQTTNSGAVPLYTSAFKLYAGASGASRAVPVTPAIDPALGCGDLTDAVYGVTKPCAQTFQDTVNSVFTERFLAARVDYHASAHDLLYLRLTGDNGVQASTTDPINSVFNANNAVPIYAGQLGYTKVISPISVNSTLLSVNYTSGVYGPNNLPAALQAFPTTFTFEDGLYSNLGGQDASYPQGVRERQWQLVDDYSWIHGRHNLKAGVNLRKTFISSYFAGAFTSGQLSFGSMTDFFNGSLSPNSEYTQSFSRIGAEFESFYSAGFYAQDEWRITPRLALTLAARFDRNSNVSCGGCYTELSSQGSFTDTSHSAATPYNQTITAGLHQAFHNVDAITPQPRVGVAYNLNKSTAIRGGIGLFADLNPGLISDRFLTNAPSVAFFTTDSGLVAANNPNSVFAAVSQSNAAFQQGFAAGATLDQLQKEVPLGFAPPNLFTINSNVQTPKYLEWNAEVQHAFGDRYMLSVNYVGNHGFDELIQGVEQNAFSPAGLAGLPTTAPDPRFGEIIALYNQGWSNYDGLTTAFRWRLSGYFSGQFSYTWSHALDNCSNDCTPEVFGTASTKFQLNPLNLRSLNYSSADYDIRHSLNARWIYTPSAALLHNPVLKRAFSGWTAAGTVFFHSGYPFSILDSGVLKKFGNLSGKITQPFLADFLGGPSYPSCTTPNTPCYPTSEFVSAAAQNDFGNIPRNSFRGPGFFDTDVNLTRRFVLSERWRLIVGASFYNILNHPNFGPPVTNLQSGVFGQILSTVSGPTSPYGDEAGAAVSGRVVQTLIKLSF